VAPGIEVPVLAVIHQALRRDFALGGFAAAAGEVGDGQALAAQQRGADLLEMRELELAFAQAHDQDAAADFLGGVLGAAEQAVEAGDQRLDVGRQNAAGIEVDEQMLAWSGAHAPRPS